jgi:ATP-binding cassette subfamily B protein
VKKLARYLGAYKGRLLFSLLCSAVNAGLSLCIPLLFGRCIDLIAVPGGVDLPGVKQKLLLSAGLIFVSALGAYLAAVENNRVTAGVVRDLRMAAFARLQVLPLAYLDTHASGETLSRVVNDVDRFADGLLMGFTQFFSGVITIAGTLALLFALSWQVALTVVVLTPLSLVTAHFIAHRSARYFRRQAAVRGELTAVTEETVGSLKTVKAFGQEKNAREKFGGVNRALQGVSLKAIFISSVTNPGTRFVNALVYAGVALTGALSVLGVLGGGLTVGLLTSALGFANQYTKPFNEISSVFAEMQNSLTCAARVLELIAVPAEPPEREGAAAIGRAEGSVEIRDMAFSYTPDRDFIKGFNLSVKKGQKAAIVGATGCGKTTVINLLMRFYEISGGAILLDGRDIRDITKKSLRENVGMVLQDTWLKNASVRENLLEGRPEASDEEMIAAAKRTHAHSFIKRLPQGYDTLLGEDGGALSQGQKQLLCITRAMLADPNILILDEATSSIDLATEIKVQKAFDELTAGRTCFIVAHRLSTIMHCDVIAVMDGGKIVESGTHEELLARGGAYARLWTSRN